MTRFKPGVLISVNTEFFNGVCVLLEDKICRELMWLACRHHVMILAKVHYSPCAAVHLIHHIFQSSRYITLLGKCDTGLNVISGTEPYNETALGFLKKLTERKSDSEIRGQELIELKMVVLEVSLQ